ncbi:MAG: beta 1-4 rhamnosyltransferase Cps2T, partial [Lactobacillaceae bacterium]
SSKLNLLLDVGFNKEVGENVALYWNKENNNLAQLIKHVEETDYSNMENEAKERVQNFFSWDYIIEKYERVFI